ncbi:Fusaric acid resistance protein-like-domain-containing protein [Phellopilus nigrolimitatus]|nr:Fusaric acid resistance protein-like-domain-containing protein [Phellopilus nigrolimitatus]
MENEGQLRSPGASQRTKKRVSRPSVLDTSFSTAATTSSRPDSILEEGEGGPRARASIVQSPAEDFFPQHDTTDTTESDYDSDATERYESSAPSTPPPEEPNKSRWVSIPDIPVLYRNILKCAVAYFIASLFTFVPPLSHLIGDITSDGSKIPSPSGHMVATVAVYFNPAKTYGAMLEADLFCLFGLAWAAFVGLGSMGMFWWIDVKPGWEWLADLVVIVWIGLGMTAVAWMKVWMAKPTFNTACSMTTIILFVVVVKEGGLFTLLQVSAIIIIGSLVSNVVCYVLWPQKAATGLQSNMSRTLDSFATLLSLLTRTFLLEDADAGPAASQGRLQRAVDSHQTSFTSLQKSLAEARTEWRIPGNGGSVEMTQAYEDAVDCMQRLAQHLNGLRSGTRLQLELAQAARDGRIVLKGSEPDIRKGKRVGGEEAATLQAAAVIFSELVDDMGPPLNALSDACTNTLKRLREAFAQRQHAGASEPRRFFQLTEDIQRALFTFESTSNQAVLRVYRSSDVLADDGGDNDNDNGLLKRSGADETVFLVYFFIFTLQEFSKELTALVDAMSRIYAIERVKGEQRWWRRFDRFFSCFGCRGRIFKAPHTQAAHRPAVFPKVRPHAPNTVLTPSGENLSARVRVGQWFWRLGGKLKERNVKHAFKAGMATAILAAPAFFDRTRPTFVEYRGEWALISFFVVMSPTIGATNFLSLHRVLGTLLGAVVAAVVYSLFPENPIALSVFGFFYSIPCFYYIVSKPQYASSGRFVLLTYNLTCLYSYNVRERDVSVVEIAYHRSASVIIGVVYAGLVSRLWWPAEARRELGNALSEFCLNMGWLYTHLVAANSGIPVHVSSSQVNLLNDAKTSVLLPKSISAKLNDSIQTFMAMELHLQIKLIELQGLLAQAQHEPRLKGPFPVKMYRSILTSLQTILDKLHSMRCVTTREEWYSVRRDFVLPVNRERREMVGNIILYFSVLSAAFSLKTPLPPYLPPAEKSRQRLVEAIRKLDVVKNRDVRGSRQLLYFAYALTMKSVIQELDYLGRTLQGAFGVIGQTTEEFEALFRPGGQLSPSPTDKLV